MKLIKINTDHYVVVDDLEITQACYVYKNHENVHGRGIFYLPPDTDFVAFNKEAKDISIITHSTKPVDNVNGFPAFIVGGVQELSLQKVKELIGEVDVEKKALAFAEAESYGKLNGDLWKGFLFGYNQALEDNKEKKYTEEDIRKAYDEGYSVRDAHGDRSDNMTSDEYVKSLQPKTEWEVELVDGKLKLK